MPRADRNLRRFVHMLLPDGAAARVDGQFVVVRDGRTMVAAVAEVAALASAGVVRVDREGCHPTVDTAGWLRRQLVEVPEDAFAVQHRHDVRDADGVRVNLRENPLARLSTAGAGDVPFLAPHQLEAGERVRQMCERAQLMPRGDNELLGSAHGGRAWPGERHRRDGSRSPEGPVGDL